MKFNIYHTNDIHSNFEFLGKVNNYLKKNKKDEDFYFDSGDFLDLRNIIVQGDKGKMALDLMVKSKIDAMAIGNNEIDLGYDALEEIGEKIDINIVASNLRDAHGEKLKNIPTSTIINKNGNRYLILGFEPYFDGNLKGGVYNSFFMLDNLMTINPYTELEKEIEENNGKYDFIILLSHMGYFIDETILEKYKNVDLIFGGHTHQVINEGKYSQSGKGEFLGHTEIEIKDGKLKVLKNIQIDLSNEVITDKYKNLLEEKEKNADRILEIEIESVDNLDFNAYEECRLINFICDSLYKEFNCDLAIMHNGIADNSLLKPISKKSLILTMPSKLNPSFYKLKGKKIKEAILLSFNEEHIREEGKGAGFRGKTLGTLGYSSNIKIKVNPFEVTIDGNELLDDKEYIIATDDYLQRGTGYPSLSKSDEETTYHKWFIRDLVENYLMDKEVFKTSLIKRIIK